MRSYIFKSPTLSLSLFLPVALFTSCDKGSDPSYEIEAIKLSAENKLLRTQAKEAETRRQELESELSTLREQLNSLESLAEGSTTINHNQVKVGFADGVESLRQQVEKDKPHLKVLNYTVENKSLDPEFPFTASIAMKVHNSQKSQEQVLRWQGKGSTKGKWTFSYTPQTAKSTQLASSNTSNSGLRTQSLQNQLDQRKKKAEPEKKQQPIRKQLRGDHIIVWPNGL